MSRFFRREFRLPWRTRTAIRRDVDEELAFHVDMRVRELVERGIPPHDARDIAASEFGDIADARRDIETIDLAVEASTRRRNTMDTITQSVRHALRRLRRAPLFTVTSVLTLTIGIGACSLMLSLVSSILIKPLPYGQPDRIQMVWASFPNSSLGFVEQPTHGRVLTLLRDNLQAWDAFAGFRGASYNLGDPTNPERLSGVETTGDFFRALGVSPQMGRFYARPNEEPGNDHVAVISDGLWRRRFGATADVVGRTVSLNAESFTIIGVAPPGFAFPRGSEMPGDFQFAATPDLWTPITPPKRGPSDLAIVGRLRPGITEAAAKSDMDRAIKVIEAAIPQAKGNVNQTIVPLRRQMIGNIQMTLVSLLVAVLLVLIIACVNTAQLLLAQLHARRVELAIRAALGASARRLGLDVMIEVVLLGAAGGLGGLLFAAGGLRAIRSIGAAQLPRASEIAFDATSVLVALAVSVAAAALASLLPLLIGNRGSMIETIRSGGRGGGQSRISLRARRTLIVGELAASLVLLTGAGLLIRSLSQQLHGAFGFDASHGLTFEVSLPLIRYPEHQARTSMEHEPAVRFITGALNELRAVPGVDAAAIGKPLPLSGAQEATVFTPEGDLPPLGPGDQTPIAQFTVASPDMYRALGAPIIAGRDFTADDQVASVPVVIINQSMAEWLWPGKPAVGKRLRVGPPRIAPPLPPFMTVIGVVANMKRYGLTETPRPEMIVPYTQNPYPTFSTMQFVVRSRLPAAALLPSLRHALARVDASIPIAGVHTIDDLVSTSASNARFVTRFMTGFGIVALTLAIIGVYGVIGYSVQQRRSEFGIRRALGASPREIVMLILRQCAALTAAGIGIGAALAIPAGFGLRHLLFNVSPFDSRTFIGATMLIVAGTTAACLFPALAASRVEPRTALEEQ